MEIKGPEECWPWQGMRINGYGGMRFQYRVFLAHRLAWFLTNGPIPDGMFVLHSCDNPICCNPAHLKTGTQADNMREKVSRLRHRSENGEALSYRKLTLDQAMEIRRRAVNGEKQDALAAEFGVSQSVVSRLKNGKTWKFSIRQSA